MLNVNEQCRWQVNLLQYCPLELVACRELHFIALFLKTRMLGYFSGRACLGRNVLPCADVQRSSEIAPEGVGTVSVCDAQRRAHTAVSVRFIRLPLNAEALALQSSAVTARRIFISRFPWDARPWTRRARLSHYAARFATPFFLSPGKRKPEGKSRTIRLLCM